MTRAAGARARGRGLAAAAAPLVALAALTAAELKVAVLPVDGARRAAALITLLLGKVGVVIVFCLRADLRRRSAARLALIALAFAVGVAIVQMLEAAFQARVR